MTRSAVCAIHPSVLDTGNVDRSTSPIATEWCGGGINRVGRRSVTGPAALLFINVMETRPATYKEYVIYSALRNCYYHAVRGSRETSTTQTAALGM
jgi:hypothetical protein